MFTPYGNSPNTNNYNTYGAAISTGEGYVLDRIEGAKMALSVRKLTQGYTGNYARIRRVSDNAETNITAVYGGFVTENAITENGQSLSEWLNGSQGAGRIWFDQSGTGINATQTVATNQYPFRNVFTGNRAAFASVPLSDYLWNLPMSIGNYQFGAGKQFTMHLVFKSNVNINSDYRPYYFLGSMDGKVNGFTVTFSGTSNSRDIRLNIQLGDLTNCAYLCTSKLFDNTQAHQVTIIYDGTINTSWIDRLTVIVDGVTEPLTPISLIGAFPAHCTQPTAAPRIWAAFSAVMQSGISELLLWNRLLTTDEAQWLQQNTRKTYGL